ncbi:MAG: hypothetical protein R3Y08_07120 [Rikenellaceae bacterium]
MRKIPYTLFAMLLFAMPLHAQVEKQVEVTKTYIPTVPQVDKPILKAEVADTAYINPDVDYSITPLSINTQLQSKSINPATITYWEFNKPSLAQVKIGAGLPLNSLLQAHVSGQNADIGYLAASLRHRANYSDLESASGEMVNATELLNCASVAGGLYFGARTLEGELSYSNDSYSRYAFKQLNSSKVNYQDIDVALRFGDSFVDLRKFNFSIDGAYSRFIDRDSEATNTTKFGFNFGQNSSLGNVIFGVNYKYIDAGKSYSNGTASAYASIYDSYAMWQVELGALYYFDQTSINEVATPHHYLIPRVLIKGNSISLFSPFVEIGGSLTQNSFEQLARQNPYIMSGTVAKSSVEYNSMIGVERGDSSGLFNVKGYLGYDIRPNYNYYQLHVVEQLGEVEESYFMLEQAKMNRFSINAVLDYSPISGLDLSFEGHIYSYNRSEDVDALNSLSKFECAVGAKYSHRKFGAALKAQYMSSRDYSVQYMGGDTTIERLPSCVNLTASFDWTLNDKVSLFVDGNNLLNQKLYPWVMYRGYGIEVTAGAKIKL